MRTEEHKKAGLLYLLGALVWFAAVTWVNFHGAQWYNFDMFADASFARLAAQQHSLFPEGWVFGNQYYVIATPAVAALFQMLFHNTLLSMALASTLMYALILLCFYWCCRELFSLKAQRLGLFCMAGATVLGDSVSSCTYGFQILFSMASYYACYVLVILLHLGIWVRIRRGRKLSALIIAAALLCSLALGVQSPRETLSLCIPLFLMTWLAALHKRAAAEQRSAWFATASLGANLLGLVLNGLVKRTWGSHYASNVGTLDMELQPSELLQRGKEALSAFADLVGFRYLDYSWKWKPIAALGLFLLALTLLALVLRLRRRGPDPAALPMAFCWLSLLCVLGAGVLAVRVRAIYFFVWFLLVPFSVCWLCDALEGRQKQWLGAGILLCGMLSFVFNFYPDLARYSSQRGFYQDISAWMEAHDVQTVYGDYQAPTIAACTGDALAYSSVFPNLSADSPDGKGLLIPNGSPVEVSAYRAVDPEHAVLILSDSPYDDSSGYRYLQAHASDTYRQRFEECFTPEAVFESLYVTYHVYSFRDAEIFPPDSVP